MNKSEAHRDLVYQMTMSVARKMLMDGVMSRNDYVEFDKRMQEKYKPILGDLFFNINLL